MFETTRVDPDRSEIDPDRPEIDPLKIIVKRQFEGDLKSLFRQALKKKFNLKFWDTVHFQGAALHPILFGDSCISEEMREEAFFVEMEEKTEEEIKVYLEAEKQEQQKKKRKSLEKLEVKDIPPAKKRKLTVLERMRNNRLQKQKQVPKDEYSRFKAIVKNLHETYLPTQIEEFEKNPLVLDCAAGESASLGEESQANFYHSRFINIVRTRFLLLHN